MRKKEEEKLGRKMKDEEERDGEWEKAKKIGNYFLFCLMRKKALKEDLQRRPAPRAEAAEGEPAAAVVQHIYRWLFTFLKCKE